MPAQPKTIYIEGDSIATHKMSGIGHTTLEIVRALDQNNLREYRVVLIVPSGKSSIIEGYGFKNINLKKFPKGYKYINYLLTKTSLPLPIDLLFGRGVYIFPNYKNWWTPFSKSITYIHDAAFLIYPDTVHPKNLAYLQNNISRWIKRTDVVVTVSKASKGELCDFYEELSAKITVIYNGIDNKHYYPRSSAEVEQVKKKYQLPHKKYFLYVGNLEPRKNVLNLLEAYKLYADSSEDIKPLVLVSGSGWNSELIDNKIKYLKDKGYAIYHPSAYVTDADLPAVYSGSYALTHLAVHEGFGIPPFQAASCGVPVILSNIPVMKELCVGSSIKYVDPYRPEEIAQQMNSDLSSQTLSKTILERYTWKKSSNRLLELIRNL